MDKYTQNNKTIYFEYTRINMSGSSDLHLSEMETFKKGVEDEKLIENIVLPSSREDYIGFIFLVRKGSSAIGVEFVFYCSQSLVKYFDYYREMYLSRYWSVNIGIGLNKKNVYSYEFQYFDHEKFLVTTRNTIHQK